MLTCSKGHKHLTEEGKFQCQNGRLGWFTCRGAGDAAQRPGAPLEGHFYHLSEDEAVACTYTE